MSQAIQHGPHDAEAFEEVEWTPHLPTETFGERLRYLRVTLDLSAEEAARRCHIKPATWRTWEVGTYPPTRSGVLKGEVAIADAIADRLRPPGTQRRPLRNWLLWGTTMDRYTENPVQARLFEPSAGADARRRGHLQAL